MKVKNDKKQGFIKKLLRYKTLLLMLLPSAALVLVFPICLSADWSWLLSGLIMRMEYSGVHG